MPDKDGYPTEEELMVIEKWDVTKHPVQDLLEHIEECWWEPGWGFAVRGKRVLRLDLHTGGWSGNETIIGALQTNRLFWALYWQKSRSGGHYTFRIPLKKE